MATKGRGAVLSELEHLPGPLMKFLVWLRNVGLLVSLPRIPFIFGMEDIEEAPCWITSNQMIYTNERTEFSICFSMRKTHKIFILNSWCQVTKINHSDMKIV